MARGLKGRTLVCWLLRGRPPVSTYRAFATIIKLQPTARAYPLSDNSPLHTGPLNLPPADRAYRFASCELLLLYPAPSRTLRSPGPLWTRLRAGRASPLFATRALTPTPTEVGGVAGVRVHGGLRGRGRRLDVQGAAAPQKKRSLPAGIGAKALAEA